MGVSNLCNAAFLSSDYRSKAEDTMRQFTFDAAKFRELVLYIAENSEDDPKFGVVKLNKILYYSDFEAYRRLERPITGATYRKYREGPAPSEILEQRRVMEDSGRIAVETRPYFSGAQQRIVPLSEPDTGIFTDAELAVVDEAITGMRHMTAFEAASLSHRELGWQTAEYGEVIPYQTAWLSPGPLPQEAEEHARKVVEKLGRA